MNTRPSEPSLLSCQLLLIFALEDVKWIDLEKKPRAIINHLSRRFCISHYVLIP